jgi:capsular polysaccharide biosynthesis protein
MANLTTYPGPNTFDPDAPLGDVPLFQPDVTLVPWGSETPRGARRAAGLFDASKQPIAAGTCWRTIEEPITVTPDWDGTKAPRQLSGNWLFGGLFYGHFGHFLCETTARLWALDQLTDVKGILFYPKNQMTHERRHTRHLLPFFDAMGLGHLEILAPQAPVEVEALCIPEQGFGIHSMISGRPEYRNYMRRKLGREIAPDGPENIYISRTHLPTKRGSVVLETRVAALMEKAGYTVFHPQENPLEVQIAHYKAARAVVSLDASALHMAAMLVRPSTQVAILNRGPSQNIEDYIAQFRSFAKIAPLRIDAVQAFWFQTDRRVVKRETHALLDFKAIGAALAAAGFLPKGTKWTNPTASQITAAIADLEKRTGVTMTRHDVS